MGYMICSKCKIYYKLESGESKKDFASECNCGSKLRYVEKLDIVDPSWRQTPIQRKPTTTEILKKKVQSLRNALDTKIKNPIIQFYNNLRYRFQNTSNWNNNYNAHQGMQAGFISSVMNELNLNNLQWTLIIPFTILITIILTIDQGILTLLIFILLAALGYLIKDPVVGAKNALITGVISFFLGSLLTGSFLFLIPLTIVGAINGAVCGFIGGYLRTRS